MKKGKIKLQIITSLYYFHRYVSQNDEIARLQLENGVLQEKLTNEKRKISLLEVNYMK